MERIKLYIQTGILFGTEIKFDIERMIKHTDIPIATKISAKVSRYPHHQFAVLISHPVIIS